MKPIEMNMSETAAQDEALAGTDATKAKGCVANKPLTIPALTIKDLGPRVDEADRYKPPRIRGYLACIEILKWQGEEWAKAHAAMERQPRTAASVRRRAIEHYGPEEGWEDGEGTVWSREEMIREIQRYADFLRACGDDSEAFQLSLMPPEQQKRWCVLGDGLVVKRRLIPENHIPEEYK